VAAAPLPAPREPGRYRVALVCLGNICRSPIAAAVLRARLADAGLDDRVEVLSSGTGDWHVGDPMDQRAAATLTAAGYDVGHTAQQIRPSWLDDCDLILAMDAANRRDIAALGPAEDGRLRMFRDFDPVDPGSDVPDPYYGGPEGFDRVLEMVERTCDALVEALR
jgi:protein-tyrosine phosphatase